MQQTDKVRKIAFVGDHLPRCRARSRASESPPLKLRTPWYRAAATRVHVSPGASGIGPPLMVGHAPVRAWWASAHARICSIVNGGRARWLRTPRWSVRSRANETPPGSPRFPERSGHRSS